MFYSCLLTSLCANAKSDGLVMAREPAEGAFDMKLIEPITLPSQSPVLLPKVDLTEETLCPYGWTAWHEYCFSLMEAMPYTRCPSDITRFKTGFVNEMSVGLVGVCQWEETVSPDLLCPLGYTLQPSKGEDLPPVHLDQGHIVDVDPVIADIDLQAHLQAQQDILAIAPDIPSVWDVQDQTGSNEQHRRLNTKDYPKKLDNTICVYEPCLGNNCPVTPAPPTQRMVIPQTICPEFFEPIVREVDPYNFQPRMFQRCRRIHYYKGQAYCPQGFDLFGDGLSLFEFGEKIHEGYDFNQTDPLSEVLGYAALDVVPPNSGTAATCLQLVSVPREFCDRYECENDVIRDSQKIIKQWAFARLESDPDLAWFYASPSGKDLKYTPLAKHYIPKPGQPSFLDRQEMKRENQNERTVPSWAMDGQIDRATF